MFVDDVDLLPSSSEKKRFESSSHYTKEKLTPPTIHISLHFLYLCLQTAETRERERKKEIHKERERVLLFEKRKRLYISQRARERERVGGLSQGNRFNRWAVEILKSE